MQESARALPSAIVDRSEVSSASPISWPSHAILSNQILCYFGFFLIAWIVATISLLVTNKRHDGNLVALVLIFFSAQAFGSVVAGLMADVKGRRISFLSMSIVLLVGLLGFFLCFFVSPVSVGLRESVLVPINLVSLTSTSTADNPVQTSLTSHPRSVGGIPQLWSVLFLLIGIATGITGFAVGGLYPIIGILLTESEKSEGRLKKTASMFCMQGLGHLCARLIVGTLFYFDPSITIVRIFWSLIGIAFTFCLFLCGGIFLFVKESTTFLHSYSFSESFVQRYTGTDLTSSLLSHNYTPTLPTTLKRCISLIKKYLPVFRWDLIGTSVPWFLFDLSFYGDGVFHFLLVQRVKGFDTDKDENSFAIVVLIVCLLGYLVATVFINRIVVKLFQILGFVVLAFVYFGLALSLYSISHANDANEHQGISEFLGASLLYDCVFRFFIFIPNLTAFLIPLDAFPTKVRGSFVGITVSCSRLGAVVGILLNWLVFEPHFSRAAMLCFCAATAVLGAAVTRAFTPHVMPAEEDLAKLDIQYLSRLFPTPKTPRHQLFKSLELNTDPNWDTKQKSLMSISSRKGQAHENSYFANTPQRSSSVVTNTI